jgi:putative endonuclease
MYSEKWFYVYIMTNRSKNFYVGVTNNIRERTFQHKTGVFEGFTSKYKLDRLVYWEQFKYVNSAIAREKQLKRWTRTKKMQLIVSMNPEWKDLAEGWFADPQQGQNA